MNWTYSMIRMPGNKGDNAHLARVTSRSRSSDEEINIRFFTNLDTHATKVRKKRTGGQKLIIDHL